MKKLKDIDYKYNIRGWLTAINDEELAVSNDGFVNPGEGDLFAFKISYDDILNPLGNTTALFNGNIAETFWKTSTDNTERQYGYEYDKLNRLTKANFIKDPFYGGDEAGGYDEIIEYDKNGNITFLDRMGKIQSDSQPIDQLTYTYDGNQLMEVYDASTSPQGFNDGNTSGDDYDYDENGNMVFDKNKGIESITYNHLNLPTQIQFANGNNIKYLYNAVGQKVNKLVQTGEEYANTDYLSGFQYRSSYTNTQGDQSEATLQYFPHAEGYVQYVDGMFFYVYNYTDHLGNIRLSYTYDYASGLIKIMEENHYYPFGLKHDSYNTNRLGYSSYTDEDEVINYVLDEQPKFVGDGSYNYKYNGKELQDELGLNMYDYGARNYDPALGRWMNIDPLAETSRRWSPYQYVYNNPLRFIDPDGMKADDITIRGNGGYQQRVLKDMQKLTNDKLGIVAGKVVVVSKGTENTGKNLTKGTSVIASLIESPHNTEIRATTGQNTTTPKDLTADGRSKAHGTEEAPGKGVGSIIEYNPNDKGENIVNDGEPSTGRPSEIGIGHELPHALHNSQGIADQTINPNIIDPDSGLKGVLTNEEISVRKIDNEIREEQGITTRPIPKVE